MRRLAVTSTALVLATLLQGCIDEGATKFSPPGRFYYPTGVEHLDVPGTQGLLFVASSNFDNRFDFGAVTSVELDQLGLPPIGADPATVPDGGYLPDLHTEGVEGAQVSIDSFADVRIGLFPLDGGTRLFIPTRDEHDKIAVVDAQLPASTRRLSCFAGGGENVDDCAFAAPSLSAAQLRGEGKPRAISPMGIAIDAANGKAFITHRVPATDPLGSSLDPESYLVELDARTPVAENALFHSIGVAGATAVALGPRYAFLVGFPAFGSRPPLIRMVDRNDPSRVFVASLGDNLRTVDGRDVAVSSDGKRIFILTRSPELLVTAELEDPLADFPRVAGVTSVILPDDPNRLVVLARPGRGDLVAVISSGDAQRGGALILVDEDSAGSMNTLYEIGRQPVGLAVARSGDAARLFVTTFSDGQVVVIDVPDVNDPREARLIARLGRRQDCLLQDEETGNACASEQ